MKDKNKNFKYENVKPNESADFEMCYSEAVRLVAYLKNSLQQMAASYKASIDKCSGGQ